MWRSSAWRLPGIAVVVLVAAGGDRAAASESPSEEAEGPSDAASESAPEKPEGSSDEGAAEPLAGWDGGFYLRSRDGRFRLEPSGRLQLRHDTLIVDRGDNETAFQVRRGRFKLSGHAWTPKLRYAMQLGLGGGDVALLDYWAEWRFGDSPVRLRVGQWKKPFSRQFMTSSGDLDLVDRAPTDDAFGSGRDLGVALHDGYYSSPRFEWALGLFNGTGIAPSTTGDVRVDPESGEGRLVSSSRGNVPQRFDPMLVARLGYNTPDLDGYTESDLDGGPLRAGIAASAMVGFDVVDEQRGRVRGQIDGILKARGLSLSAAYYLGADQSGANLVDLGELGTGLHAQLSYLIGEHLMPVVRYARVDLPGSGGDQQNGTLGLTALLFGHGVKLQTDASVIDTKRTDGPDQWRVRSQLQVEF